MIKSIISFADYANRFAVDEHVFSICVMAMEQGALHVDTTNGMGATLGPLFMYYSWLFRQDLWDRYLALCPDVALFWHVVVSWGHGHVFPDVSVKRMRDTPVLWADLGLVKSRASWVQDEVSQRIRHSLRFAWIAAVVVG
jgi:hypothetical protein